MSHGGQCPQRSTQHTSQEIPLTLVPQGREEGQPGADPSNGPGKAAPLFPGHPTQEPGLGLVPSTGLALEEEVTSGLWSWHHEPSRGVRQDPKSLYSHPEALLHGRRGQALQSTTVGRLQPQQTERVLTRPPVFSFSAWGGEGEGDVS